MNVGLPNMNEKIKKAGILGGTFDPVHCGHLIIAQEALEKFNLDKVIFIPSGMPPHKNISEVTAPEHRLNMVRLATEGNPYFEVSCIELDRKGYTYTVDTLISLMNIYGGSVELYFIIGADVLQDLLTWRDPDRVFGMCQFIAIPRPGCLNSTFAEETEYLVKTHKAVIHSIETPPIEISSTCIRQRVRMGKSIKNLVPEAVLGYIIENRLYVQ